MPTKATPVCKAAWTMNFPTNVKMLFRASMASQLGILWSDSPSKMGIPPKNIPVSRALKAVQKYSRIRAPASAYIINETLLLQL